MSVKVMGVVWESALPQREKLVLLAYADHAHDDGSKVFPSVGLVARKTGYSTRSVQRISKTLLEKEYMIQEGTTKYGTKLYRIMVNNLPMLPPYLGDDKLTGVKYGGDSLSEAGVTKRQGEGKGGDKLTPPGMTTATLGGDIAMSPDPSLTININHQEEEENIFTLYESSIGPLTGKIGEELKSLEDDYPKMWIEDAFAIAKKNKAKNLKYVTAILSRWNSNGKDDGYKPKGNKKGVDLSAFDKVRQEMEQG